MQIQQPQRYFHEQTAHHSYSNRNKSSNHMQVLCRISFDLDQNSQELIVFQNASLQQLTQQLIDKLKTACLIEEQDALQMTTQEKDVLKGQIKLRIEEKMEHNTEKSLQAARWRNKLKDIIEEKIRTPMDSLVSPSTQRQGLGEVKNKSVSYFKYNQVQSEQNCRQREIIERMKVLEKEIKGQSKSKESKRERLYDLGKQTEQIKEYLYKAHEYQTLSQELAECTFHPNIRKINTQANTQPHSDVFSRLYNQAADKKEKIKRIASEIQSRKLEQEKSLNFIPKINQCSKEIVMAKKQQKINVYDTLYQQASVIKEHKNKFQPEYTFHPTISAKSQQILKDKSTKRLNPLKHQVHTSKKNIGRQSSEVSLQWLGLKNQYSKSPIKNKPKKRAGNSKANKGSQLSLQEWKEQQETIKKTNYQKEKQYQSEQTLKQNIFSKKPFKKNKSHNKNQHCYVQSKDIKRQKITILDETQITCNTEQSLPNTKKKSSRQCIPFQKSRGALRSRQDWENESEISILSLNDSKGFQKDKRRGLDPFAFFKQKQKSVNKQNMKQCKQEGIELQFSKRKNKIFQDIFTYLLSQAKLESQITYQAIISSPSIPQFLKHVFYPMAQEMRELQVGLDQEQFVWSMIRIFDSLSLQQRGWILGWGLKLQQPVLSTTKLR